MDGAQSAMLRDVGLLVMRLGAGGLMLLGHGWGKLIAFGDKSATFADPLGVGPTTSMALAIFAEVFCALGVMTGTLTRLAATALAVTMLTAAFVVHAADPWSKKEFALLYAVPYLTLILTGPGRFSVDNRLLPALARWRNRT